MEFAGFLIEIRGQADLRRRIGPLHFIERAIVPVAVVGEVDVQQRCGVEGVDIVHAAADVVAAQGFGVQAGEGVERPVLAVVAELVVAPAEEETVFRSGVPIDAVLHGEVVVFDQRIGEEVVVAVEVRNGRVVRQRIDFGIEVVHLGVRHAAHWNDVPRNGVADEEAGGGIQAGGHWIVDLIAGGIQPEQAREVSAAFVGCGDGVDFAGGFEVEEPFGLAGIDEKEEEFVFAVVEFGYAYRAAQRSGIGVRPAGGLPGLRAQLLREGGVSGEFRCADAAPVDAAIGAGGGIPALLPVGVGQRPVVIVRAGLRGHHDVGAGGMADGGVEGDCLDLHFLDGVGDGEIGRTPELAAVGGAVNRPFVAADGAGAPVGGAGVGEAQIRVAVGQLLHAYRIAGLQDEAIAEGGQVHYRFVVHDLRRGSAQCVKQRRLFGDGDGRGGLADLHPDAAEVDASA